MADLGDHLEPGAFAVGNDEQYRPVQASIGRFLAKIRATPG